MNNASAHRTLSTEVEAAVERDGDVEAYVEGSRKVTYAEWLDRADAVAAAWLDAGVAANDVVAIALPASIDYAVCYLAAIRIGAIPTGLNTRLGPRELTGILDRCTPSLLVDEDTHSIETLDLASTRPRQFDRSEIASAVGSPHRLAHPHLGSEDDPICIVWTSGSTAQPKGVWFDNRSHRELASMGGLMSAYADRRLLPMPFAHAGYMTRVWDQAKHSITVIISPGAWSALEMLRVLEGQRVTVGQGVPTQWQKVVDLDEIHDADLTALRICGTGAAPVPPELVVAMRERLGCPILVRFACTESPILTGTLPDDPPEVLLHTVGRPAPGVELEIRDEDGIPLETDTVGTLHARSPGSMKGYWNAPELEGPGPDGWLRLGDLGRIDADGNLTLCGRSGDMYIRGGYNVYPLEVQHVIEEHPAAAAAAVVGVEAPVIGQTGTAFVVRAVETDLSEAEFPDVIRRWVRERLADYKVPDRVEIVDALPLTAMMKVDTKRLREIAGNLDRDAPIARPKRP